MKLNFEKRTRAHRPLLKLFWNKCKDWCIRKLEGDVVEDRFIPVFLVRLPRFVPA